MNVRGIGNGHDFDANGNGRYNEDDGYISIYVPNGHLYGRPEDRVMAGKEVWNYTRLPFSTLNWEEEPYRGQLGRKISRDVLEIPFDELKDLGYSDPGVRQAVLISRRPHNIPLSVKRKGIGISGKDLIADRLGIPALNGHSDEWLSGQLVEQDIINLGNLRYRTSHLALSFRGDCGIRTYDDLRGSRGMIIATEFYNSLVHNALMKFAGLERDQYEIIPTEGNTEAFVVSGEADGMLDTVERGQSTRELKKNPRVQLVVLGPMVMKCSTPYLIANGSTESRFPDFTAQLVRNVKHGVEEVGRRYPDLYGDKFDYSLLNTSSSDSGRFLKATPHKNPAIA